MSAKSWTDVIGAIVIVALITTLVAHPATASIVSSLGQSFSGALTAAQGGTVASSSPGPYGSTVAGSIGIH